jgi:hypothetical protein
VTGKPRIESEGGTGGNRIFKKMNVADLKTAGSEILSMVYFLIDERKRGDRR